MRSLSSALFSVHHLIIERYAIFVVVFADQSRPLYLFHDGRFYHDRLSLRRRLAVVHLPKY